MGSIRGAVTVPRQLLVHVTTGDPSALATPDPPSGRQPSVACVLLASSAGGAAPWTAGRPPAQAVGCPRPWAPGCLCMGRGQMAERAPLTV